jgi:hypothetical protein
MSDPECSSHRLTTALAAALILMGFGSAAPSAVAAATPMVELGQASTYAVLSGASVGNTVSAPGAPHTTLRGDLGVKANTQPTGFPPGVVTGTTRVGTTAAEQAHSAVVAAYTEIAARTGGSALAGALAGTTITPGLHTVAGAASNTTTVTLDGGGDPNAVFVFQIDGAMTTAAGSRVVLTNGAKASRVFWQVNGAAAVGANATFAGTLIALDAVAVGNGTMFNGRAFARNGALTLDANEFYSSPPVVTVDGGAAASTSDTTPTISGTTNVEAPAVITVTINGQVLTATPSGGAWSATSAILANGTYTVGASGTDGAGNQTSATQQLTVDTVLPQISIDGGSARTTNDPTPTVSGTSDAASGTLVRVSVDSQLLTAVVQLTGTWAVRPAALADGTHTVTASVDDPAGNQGTDSQAMTVDTIAPAVTITGGPSALTNDPTPVISGTAAVAPGTTVTVNLADETLTGPVQTDGSWSVTASFLSNGPHRVVLSVSDAAGTPSLFTQILTVDTAAPLVGINGGSTATTDDVSPTVAGTSNAAPGTTVTVTIAGQIMTTLLQADRTWNVTPSFVGEGTWPVVASASDSAGNEGRADQSLTIAAAPTGQVGTGATGDTGATGSAGATGDAGLTGGTGAPGTTVTTDEEGATGVTDVTSVTDQATVAPNSRQRIGRFSLWIGTRVTAPAVGNVFGVAGGDVKIKGLMRSIRLTRAATRIAAGQSARLRITPRGNARTARAAFRKIRSAVGRGKIVTARITIKVADDGGNTRTVARRVRLTKYRALPPTATRTATTGAVR